MGKDFHSKWYRQEENGTFTRIGLGSYEVKYDDMDGQEPQTFTHDFEDIGRSQYLYAMFGAPNPSGVPQLTLCQAPAGIHLPHYDDPEIAAQGIFKLSDLRAYDFNHPAWQRQVAAMGGSMKLTEVTRYLRETLIPLVTFHAQGREMYCTFIIA